jgi:hypothetical protein
MENPTPVTPVPKIPEPPVEDDSLEVMETGSLFQTETVTEIDDKKPFKLDTTKYLKQALLIILIVAAFLILAMIFLFKSEIDEAAKLTNLFL